jgi:hypothetical protein
MLWLLRSLVVLKCIEDGNNMLSRNVNKHLHRFTFFMSLLAHSVLQKFAHPKYEVSPPGNVGFLEYTAVGVFCLLLIIHGGLHVHVTINISEIASARD